jgi:glutathione S-transferase
MKIYGDLISPFVRMTLVTAYECGIAAKIEHVKETVHIAQVNPTLTQLSGLGKIPVLETDHHHAVFDSRVIMEYLAHHAGNKSLFPDDGAKRFRILTLLALGQGLADVSVGYRYETAARPAELRWPDWMARTEARIHSTADQVEHHWQNDLSDVTAGTIALAVTLSYIDFRIPAINWREGHPSLAVFHDDFSQRPSMKATALS